MSTAPNKKRVHIVGPGGFPYFKMFFEHGGYEIVRDPGPDWSKSLDLICLTGGEDIWPGLYNEQPIKGVQFNVQRDKRDRDAIKKALDARLLLVGICRGGQLLHVVNGGRLWQDVNNHREAHLITDLTTGWSFPASSTHHQQFREGNDFSVAARVLAIGDDKGGGSTEKYADRSQWGPSPFGPPEQDLEVLWYEKTRSLCFQPHPELDGFPELREYFFMCLDRRLNAL